jgi:hypothetical protein
MSSDKSAYQLMDDWANIFSVKPLKTKGTLNTKQKGISALEISIPAPTLIRDQEFLDKLEKHYEALLKTGLNLDVGEVVPTATPSLPAIKKHLASMTSVLNGSHSIVEKQETDTNSFHKSLLDPLALLARVSMADGGSVLTKVAAESLDEELRELHPHVVTQRAHDMQGSGSGSGSNSTTPDHTILAEYEENTTNLMSIEDKNTAFGHTKWRDLDDLVGKGQIKGMADAPKVWRQVSQLLLLLSSRTLWP